MSFFAILIFSVLVVGGTLFEKSEDNQAEKKEIEVVANKPIETKPVKEEITPEPVKEEITPEPVKEEITPELVKEEITPEPVKEEITPEPVKEVAKELDDSEDLGTNYLRLVLYIIGGLLAASTGMYFFSRKRNSTPQNFQPETIKPQPVEEEVQPETTEPQPETTEPQPETTEPQPETTEPQSVEEEVQLETTEEQKTEEDEKNKK